jgi:hypothetical protein
MAYFLGIGRGQKGPVTTPGQRRKSHGQATLPLKTPEVGSPEIVKLVEHVEASPATRRGGRRKA